MIIVTKVSSLEELNLKFTNDVDIFYRKLNKNLGYAQNFFYIK